MPDKKQQQVGVRGSLEVGINEYTHPSSLPLSSVEKELFYVEISLSPQQVNKSTDAQVQTPSTIMFADVKTLSVNDTSVDKKVTIRLVSLTQKKEIARSTIDLSTTLYLKPKARLILNAQKMTLTEGPADQKGLLNMSVKLVQTA